MSFPAKCDKDMAANSSSSTNAPKSSNEGKRILEELQRKASELSTILSSQATKPADTPTNQAGSTCSSSSRAYMPSFRRQFMSSPSPFRGKGKGKSVVKGPFMRDVILLTGPRVNSVPRQEKRVWLTENGFVISGFQLQKEWSEFVVEASLREAFEEKIPAGVDFEILMAVHSTLVKPTLAPGQGLNGIMVHRIFKEKPIYIGPVEEICDVCISSIKQSCETIEEAETITETPKAKVMLQIGEILVIVVHFLSFVLMISNINLIIILI